MIHSLYSNKEIFLRELVSNASDALEKLEFLSSSDDLYKNLNFKPAIHIELKDSKLIIQDNGIGMSEEELKSNLGTIAKSGTKAFLQELKKDENSANLIGQFGVGFYSAFMIAQKIEVFSKKPLSNEVFCFSSDASEFDVKKASDDEIEGFGTKIILHLKEGEKLDDWQLESLLKKYSNHIAFPIFLTKTSYEADAASSEEGKSKEVRKPVQINSAKALWLESKSKISKEDYDEFYKSLSYDFQAPLFHIHTKAEGALEYSTLFYVPSKASHDLYRADYEGGIKLYVRKVFISEKERLLPSYLRFIKGIVDIEDLPLNVSREILQDNEIVKKVEGASEKKILSELARLKNSSKDEEKALFLKIHELFSKVLKEGLYGFEPKLDLLNILLFKSSANDDLIDLKTYLEQSEDKEHIYYLCGKNLKDSVLLEPYTKENKLVLLLEDDIDSIIMPMLRDYEGKSFVNIAISKADSELEEKYKDYAWLKEGLKEELKAFIKDLRFGEKSAPACIVYDENDPDFATASIMRQMGQEIDAKPILEINPKDKLWTKFSQESLGSLEFKNSAQIALGTAFLAQGMEVANASAFAKAVLA